MTNTQYAWGEEETAGIPHVDVKLTVDEYEELIQQTMEKMKQYTELKRFVIGRSMITTN